MQKAVFATVVTAGLTALSLGLAAPAVADGWDSTPVASGNDTPFNTPYRQGGPQGTPTAQAQPSAISGGPADQLPKASPGANPFVPLGPGH